jgi:hypothetical protein
MLARNTCSPSLLTLGLGPNQGQSVIALTLSCLHCHQQEGRTKIIVYTCHQISADDVIKLLTVCLTLSLNTNDCSRFSCRRWRCRRCRRLHCRLYVGDKKQNFFRPGQARMWRVISKKVLHPVQPSSGASQQMVTNDSFDARASVHDACVCAIFFLDDLMSVCEA